MKQYLFFLSVLLIVTILPTGCSSNSNVDIQNTNMEDLLTNINQMIDTITSYEYNNETNAIRLFDGKSKLTTQVTENRLIDLEEERGSVESKIVTMSQEEGGTEQSETRFYGTYIEGNKVYYGQAIDEEVMDYSQVDEQSGAINVINILSQEIELVNSSNATLLPDIKNVRGVDCYVVSLSIDSSMLMSIMMIPSFYEAMSHDINEFLPYLDNYTYNLWFSKENMRLIKVYQYMELNNDEQGNNFNFTYEWDKEFSRYNEQLDISTPIDATEAIIHDSLLAQGIREALGKPTGVVTLDDLASLIELDLSHVGINNIYGLEYCINLESLIVSIGCDRPDISPLSSLTKLKTLELHARGNTDLSPLSQLTNLGSLKLSSLDPFDISSILTLPNITELNLDWYTSFDITLLESFPKLTSLTLDAGRGITDLTPLTSLNLTKLVLRANEVKDISPLVLLKNLQSLRIIDSSLIDISPLLELPKLESLDVEIDDDADFSPISGMRNLKILQLSRHNISDITIFSELVNLQSLILDRNEITDITALSKLTNLTTLDLDSNDIYNLTPLSALTKLENLSISNNRIIDSSPLAHLTHLKVLALAGNDVFDISALENLVNLQDLNLTGNDVSDISSLKGLTELHHLCLWQNPISDITPLIENAGLGTGDEIILDEDIINDKITECIKILESRGVIVSIW